MTSVFGNRALFLLNWLRKSRSDVFRIRGIGRQPDLTSGTKETTSTAERY